MSTKNDTLIYQEPNKFAPPAQFDLSDHLAIVQGYQKFVLTRDAIHVLAEDRDLRKKQELLAAFFYPRYLKARTVLDLGANAGFYSFWALQQGASAVRCIEMDPQYIKVIQALSNHFELTNLEVVKSNITDWDEPADITLALALIHWLYSCTALFGSLSSIVGKLAQLTQYMLIIEWIDPADPAITFFNHLDWNQEFVQEPYTLEAFETALSQHFVRYELIGALSPTRRLYAAYQTAHELDLSNPLPLIFSEETVISSRLLTKNDGIEYWSRVYEGQDVIHKQTSLDLAEREGHFLAQLSHEYFPNVLSTSSEANYSLVTLEKIEGLPLLKAVPFINDTFTKFHQFIQHCLNLLEELKRHGLTHRDIHASNILIRNEKPVLIDFGWAISATQTYFTPPELNLVGRPPDGNSCDVYAMGKVFEQINQHRYPAFERVIELMTDPDASLRITDIDTLRILFASASAAADVVEMDKYARA